MARTKTTVRASCCKKACWVDSHGIIRCADSSLPKEDCVAMRAREEEEEREMIQDRKRKRMAFEDVIDALGDSNKAKMSGREYPKTCYVCYFHTRNLTKEGEKFYKVVHYVDKVPFDCCSFCVPELNTGYKVIRCLNDLIPV